MSSQRPPHPHRPRPPHDQLGGIGFHSQPSMEWDWPPRDWMIDVSFPPIEPPCESIAGWDFMGFKQLGFSLHLHFVMHFSPRITSSRSSGYNRRWCSFSSLLQPPSWRFNAAFVVLDLGWTRSWRIRCRVICVSIWVCGELTPRSSTFQLQLGLFDRWKGVNYMVCIFGDYGIWTSDLSFQGMN